MAERLLLVTGASGFLGRAIARTALQRGWQVRAFADAWPSLLPACECVTGDVADRGAVDRVFQGVTHVVHAAGLAHQFRPIQEERFQRVNVQGSQTVAEAAVRFGVHRIVAVSSVAVYGGGTGLIDESRAPAPKDAYARSKLSGEQAVLAVGGPPSGPGAVALRLATLYGEGDPGNVGRLIRAIDRGRFVRIGAGRNKKSLLYRQDAAEACMVALERDAGPTGVFNVTAPPVFMDVVVDTIVRYLGGQRRVYSVPVGMARVAAALLTPTLRLAGQPMDLRSSLAKWLNDDAYDGSRFEAAFGQVAARTPLAEGVAREVAWYRSGAAAWV